MVKLSKSYGFGDITRAEYLKKYVFPNFEDDNYLRNYLTEAGKLESDIQEILDRKNRTFDILRKWSQGEIEFTKSFMDRYSPKSRGRTLVFKNIGITKQLESLQDPLNYKYYGLSHGRSYREFLSDVADPSSSPPDFYSKPSITSDQIATWDRTENKWIVTYLEGKGPVNRETRNINLYRKQYDSSPTKQKYYWTATHINTPFLIADIEYFEKNLAYLVEDGSKTPFVAIGGRFYIEDIYKKDENQDSLLNTVVASPDSVVLDDIPFSDSNTGGLDQVIPASFSGGLSSDIPEVSTNTGVEVNPNVPTGIEYTGVNTEGGNTGGFYGFGSNGGPDTVVPGKTADNTVNAGIITGLSSAGIILIGAALLYFGKTGKKGI